MVKVGRNWVTVSLNFVVTGNRGPIGSLERFWKPGGVYKKNLQWGLFPFPLWTGAAPEELPPCLPCLMHLLCGRVTLDLRGDF